MKRYVFKCDNDKDNPDFLCHIQIEETVYQKTEVYPLFNDLKYGHSDYVDSEVNGYYCNNCDTRFTYEEVLELIVEEEE
jgi:transcription initiation factor IIE alpha subunit